MAGHYFYDPRPFYGQNAHTGLMPMEELFYGSNESVPYWMDQRMAPVPAIIDDFYYPSGYKQMVRRPEIMHKQYLPQRGENVFQPYRRSELVRDDTDMYRRSPYNFNYAGRGDGVGVVAPGGMHSEGMRGQQQPLVPLRAQDDTWVHTMSAPAQLGHGHQIYHGLPEPPPGAMPTRSVSFPNGNGNGSEQFRYVNDQYLNSNLNHSNGGGHSSNFNSNNHSNGGGQSTKQSMGASGNGSFSWQGNQNGGFTSQGQQNGTYSSDTKSLGQGTGGTKSGAVQSSTMSKQHNNNNSYGNNNSNTNSNRNNNTYGNRTAYSNGDSNQHSNAKRYNNDDSSSDSDDDDYRNNAAMVKKHGHSSSTGGNKTSSGQGHGHKVDSHSYGGFESNSRGLKNNSASQSVIVSSKKSSSHGSHGSHGKHSSGVKQSSGPASRISKLLGFQSDSSSSDDDDDRYNSHSKKGSSKNSSINHHGTHVSSYQAPTYGNSQPKQMQFSSQSKSVELQVPICCDNCERKVRTCLEKMDGVESVLCDQWKRKVIVYGNVKAENVLKRVRRVKKSSELWQNAKQQQHLQNQQYQLQQLRLSY